MTTKKLNGFKNYRNAGIVLRVDMRKRWIATGHVKVNVKLKRKWASRLSV